MWRLLLRYLAFHKLGLVVLEHALLIACILIDAGRKAPADWTPSYVAVWCVRAFIVAMTFQMFLHLRDAYDFRVRASALNVLSRVGQAVVMANAVLVFIYVISPAVLFAGISVALVLVRISVF